MSLKIRDNKEDLMIFHLDEGDSHDAILIHAKGLVSTYFNGYTIKDIEYNNNNHVVVTIEEEEALMNTSPNLLPEELESIRKQLTNEEEEKDMTTTTTLMEAAEGLTTKTAARDFLRSLGLTVSKTSYINVWRKHSLLHVAHQCAKEYDLNGMEAIELVYNGYYTMASNGLDITKYPLADVTFTEEAITGHTEASPNKETNTPDAVGEVVEEKAKGLAPKGDETTIMSELTHDELITLLEAERKAHTNEVQALQQEIKNATDRLDKGMNMYKGLRSQYNKLVEAFNLLKNTAINNHQNQKSVQQSHTSNTVTNDHRIEKSMNDSPLSKNTVTNSHQYEKSMNQPRSYTSDTVTNNHSNKISTNNPQSSICTCGTEISFKNSKFSRKIASQYPNQYRGYDYCIYCQRSLLTNGKPLSPQDITLGNHTRLPKVDMKSVLAHVNATKK